MDNSEIEFVTCQLLKKERDIFAQNDIFDLHCSGKYGIREHLSQAHHTCLMSPIPEILYRQAADIGVIDNLTESWICPVPGRG